MKIIILLAIFGLLIMATSSYEKSLFDDNDNDMESTDKRARMSLRDINVDDDDDDDDDTASFDIRQASSSNWCVPCKFGIIPCCSPNFCRIRRILPNKCIRVNSGK